LVLAVQMLGAGAARADGTGGRRREDLLQQVAGVLDYVAGDYRAAVGPDGAVLNATEYAEQRSLAADADALAQAAGLATDSALRHSLGVIAGALRDKQAPLKVAALCKAARDLIERDYGVSLAPSSVPSRQGAVRLYAAQGCNTCHGDDGGANTAAANQLTPRPANFLDATRVATVSPHRAFHAISFGVQGTAMQPATRLSEEQRWSLAFYVLSLRHLGADLAAGKRAFEAAHGPAPATAKGLALLTEEDLRDKLKVLPTEAVRRAALAYLRAEAPFAGKASATSSFALTYSKLDEGLAAYRKGERASARQLFVSAYLDGFEPHEAALRARDARLVEEVEETMMGLREAAADGGSLAQVEARIASARALLMRAESTHGDATTALLGALTITLREGLEIVLLVAALLALVRKRGHPELARYVHLGWLLAVPAGLCTFWFAGSIFGGMERELAEGIASLVAAVVLLGVTHWLLGQLGAKQWVGFLARRMGDATSSRRAGFGVLSLAFIAAYREAFEIVLFFQALVLDAGQAIHQVWIGAGIGLLLLSVVAYGLLRVGQRLKPAPFMLASSGFLALLALVLMGKGMHALQEAAVVSITALDWPQAQVVGLYATVEGLSAQGALLVLLLWSALWPWLKARSAGHTTPAP
jgi:high-affinity iron transporter